MSEKKKTVVSGGRAGIAVAAFIALACIVGIGVSIARDVDNKSTTAAGTYTLTTEDAGTMTLTVDKIVAAVDGAVGATTPAAGAFTTISASGLVTATPTAASVTNGQAITVAASHYTLNGIGGADNSTNTVTLAGASASGQLLIISVATASTNLITIADSAPVIASGAVLLDFDDSATFVSVGTNWVLLCESDN